MPLETGTFINSLVTSNPAATDGVAQGDDHIRLLKSTIKSTFPNITGAVTPTHTQLNFVAGVTSAIQTQLNTLATADTTNFNTLNSSKLNASAYTAADVLAKLLTVDGAGSTLDADTLDGTQLAALATLAGNQTFSGDKTFQGSIIEVPITLTGTTPALNPSAGTFQVWDLTGNSTPTDSFVDGESMTMMISDGTAFTVTWPSVTWVGGNAPALPTAGRAVIVFWKRASILYGLGVGNVA